MGPERRRRIDGERGAGLALGGLEIARGPQHQREVDQRARFHAAVALRAEGLHRLDGHGARFAPAPLPREGHAEVLLGAGADAAQAQAIGLDQGFSKRHLGLDVGAELEVGVADADAEVAGGAHVPRVLEARQRLGDEAEKLAQIAEDQGAARVGVEGPRQHRRIGDLVRRRDGGDVGEGRVGEIVATVLQELGDGARQGHDLEVRSLHLGGLRAHEISDRLDPVEVTEPPARHDHLPSAVVPGARTAQEGRERFERRALRLVEFAAPELRLREQEVERADDRHIGERRGARRQLAREGSAAREQASWTGISSVWRDSRSVEAALTRHARPRSARARTVSRSLPSRASSPARQYQTAACRRRPPRSRCSASIIASRSPRRSSQRPARRWPRTQSLSVSIA